jgi:hypothetical protein
VVKRTARKAVRSKQPGYLLPDVLQPAENICVCVPVPKDWGHIRAFLGQIYKLTRKETWEFKLGSAYAGKAWMDIYYCVQDEINCLMTTGCGCGCDDREPTNQRINADGILEVSYDNGETWEEVRAGDGRFSNPTLPPLSGDDGGTKRCRAANSVVTGMLQEQEATEARYTSGADYAEFVSGVVAFLVGLGVVTGGVSAVLAVISTMVAALVANITAATFSGYFTAATWDALLCIVYCNMSDDASFSEDDWQLIRQQVLSDIGGGAGNWLEKNILAMGPVGLTNLARQDRPGTRTCDLCSCEAETWCYFFDFSLATHGWGFTETGFGQYTSGQGFTGQPYGTGGGVSRLQRTFADSSLTSIQVVHSASGYTTGQKTLYLQFNAEPEQAHPLSGALNGDDILTQYNQAGFTPFDCDKIRIYWDGAGSATMLIKSVTIRGIGTNPFGVSNCV